MTGRSRLGKMSTCMRNQARTAPRTRAATPTITVIGCRSAKTMGFMRARLVGERSAGGGSPEQAVRLAAADHLLAIGVQRVVHHGLGRDQLRVVLEPQPAEA